MTTMRITRSHLSAKVDIANRMLGFDPAQVTWNTVGALTLSGAYGGHAVHRIANDGGGVSSLTGGHFPAREVSRFLDGMLAALRIAGES